MVEGLQVVPRQWPLVGQVAAAHVQWKMGMRRPAVVPVQLWTQAASLVALVQDSVAVAVAVRLHLLGVVMFLARQGQEQQDQQ